MMPAVGLMADPENRIGFGEPKFERLNMLKNSARNCKLVRSVKLVFLKTDKSTSARPGPVSVFLPKLPQVPGTGKRKAFGLSQWLTFPKREDPVKAGFTFGRSGILESPFPDRLDPICGSNGKPL